MIFSICANEDSGKSHERSRKVKNNYEKTLKSKLHITFLLICYAYYSHHKVKYPFNAFSASRRKMASLHPHFPFLNKISVPCTASGL